MLFKICFDVNLIGVGHWIENRWQSLKITRTGTLLTLVYVSLRSNASSCELALKKKVKEDTQNYKFTKSH